ncbi:MAG: hypothetical protein NWF04_08080 [Candidatus Bathyarchaeota archaeon]|nr:hypothetical protein [Candidatus Bathyarchaeota archaeon]
MQKRFRSVVCGFLVLFVLCVSTGLIVQVNADPTVSLSLRRDNGYGFGGDISGLLTARTEVSDDVVTVEFYLDDELQFTADSAPFWWSFDTFDYSFGEHIIKAVAYDNADNQATDTLSRNFVDVSNELLLEITVIIVVIVVALCIVAILIMRRRRNNP